MPIGLQNSRPFISYPHILGLTHDEFWDLYDLLKHLDTTDRPGCQSIWEKVLTMREAMRNA